MTTHTSTLFGQIRISGRYAGTHGQNGSSNYDSFHIESPVLVKATQVA
jgi:hypothetical protein